LDYIDILQEILRYIDAHIKEKLSVKKLAQRAGFLLIIFAVFSNGILVTPLWSMSG
jgi:hypothetical protein